MKTPTIVLPSTDDKKYLKNMEEDANLLHQFFERIKSLNKLVSVQYKPVTGQYSGNFTPINLPTEIPDQLCVNGAWVGFVSHGVLYRTETIECRKTFMSWVKEMMKKGIEEFWKLFPVSCPENARFYSPFAM